jgi:hypothetical protein
VFIWQESFEQPWQKNPVQLYIKRPFMITGTHCILYSTNPAADRAFFRDVLRLRHVDAGEGWLIFGLPPAEIAVHPADESGKQELYLLCEDIERFIQEMTNHKISCTPVQNQVWGLLTQITLPGGGKLGVYQPSHVRPEPSRNQPRDERV